MAALIIKTYSLSGVNKLGPIITRKRPQHKAGSSVLGLGHFGSSRRTSKSSSPQIILRAELAWRAACRQRIIKDYAVVNLPKSETMKEIKVGDRVCIRGLVHSDCLGLT